MKTLLAAIILIGFGVFGMCFNIIFRKNGKFPETEVSKNEDMKRLGIKCANEQESDLIGFSGKERRKKVSCSGNFSEACIGCSFAPSSLRKKEEERN